MPRAGADRREIKEDQVLTSTIEAVNPAVQGVARTGQHERDVTSEELLAHILSSLSDSKAEDIVQIDLRGKTAMGDYMVICSGRSTRHVAAISDRLVDTLKADLGRLARLEGKNIGDWVLIDTGDVIVHVFRPEVREFYQLEKMWLPAEEAAKRAPAPN